MRRWTRRRRRRWRWRSIWGGNQNQWKSGRRRDLEPAQELSPTSLLSPEDCFKHTSTIWFLASSISVNILIVPEKRHILYRPFKIVSDICCKRTLVFLCVNILLKNKNLRQLYFQVEVDLSPCLESF